MKKLLALVLALVMSMSLVTISNAAFSDAADIDYKEAVDVLAAVGVLEGSDGKFDPKAELTREQAAKIIAYLDLGKSTAEALPAVKVFNDVEASRWSAKFVAYCADAGYINGVGNGNFDPTGKLTGYAFGKLLLCALGYDATIEEMTGANWTIKVAKLMESNDITKDTSKLGSAVLTREEAAQYALNALKATMVDYENKGTDISLGDIGSITVGASKAKAVESKGEAYKDALGNAGTIELGEKLYGKDLKKDDDKKTDDFGRPATKWTYKNDEIGTYSDTADYVFTAKVTKKVLYNTVGKDVYDDLNATKDPTTLTVWVDGVNQDVVKGETVTHPAVSAYFDKNSTAQIGGMTGNGVLTEVTVDDNNNVTIVIINTYVLKATDDYSSKKEEVSVELADDSKATSLKDSKLSADDFDVADIKEDDYILATGVVENKKLDVKDIAKATVVTGKVTAYAEGKDVTIDGTTYKYNENISEDADNGKGVSYAINEDATIVLDAYGYIIYVDEAKASSEDYVFVREIAKTGDFSSKDTKADAVFADGTRETIVVKNGDDFKAGTVNMGWYTYTKKSTGKYELTAATKTANTEASKDGNKLTENGKAVIGDGSIKGNKSTTFVVYDDGDVDIYTGISNVPTIKCKTDDKAVVAYAVKDGNTAFAKYVFIEVTDAQVSDKNKSSSDAIYMIKFDRTGTDADDNTYYQYKAIVNGEEKTVKLDSDEMSKLTDAQLHKLYDSIRYDSKTGYITDMDEVKTDDDYTVSTLNDTAVSYKSGVLSWGVSTNFTVSDDCKVYLVVKKGVTGINDNEDDYTVSTLSASGLKAELSGYTVTGTYVSEEKDDELVNLYIYITDATPVTK